MTPKLDLEPLRNVPLDAWTKADILQLIDALEQYRNVIEMLIREKLKNEVS
jgi:hypothetical protein